MKSDSSIHRAIKFEFSAIKMNGSGNIRGFIKNRTNNFYPSKINKCLEEVISPLNNTLIIRIFTSNIFKDIFIQSFFVIVLDKFNDVF